MQYKCKENHLSIWQKFFKIFLTYFLISTFDRVWSFLLPLVNYIHLYIESKINVIKILKFFRQIDKWFSLHAYWYYLRACVIYEFLLLKVKEKKAHKWRKVVKSLLQGLWPCSELTAQKLPHGTTTTKRGKVQARKQLSYIYYAA